MKHEFQPGHLMPTHCRVYIEREGFCGLPASHDLHMPESEGEMNQSSEQGAPCSQCGCTHETAYELGRADERTLRSDICAALVEALEDVRASIAEYHKGEHSGPAEGCGCPLNVVAQIDTALAQVKTDDK